MIENLAHIHPQLQSLAVEVGALTPDPKNARKHDKRNIDAIKASLSKFGFRAALVAQRVGDSLIVRAGNGRLQAARELGFTHVPVLVFEEGDDDAVAYAIADNRTAELAEWDEETLSDLVGSLDSDFAMWLNFEPAAFFGEPDQDTAQSTTRPSVAVHADGQKTVFEKKDQAAVFASIEENTIRSVVLFFDYKTHSEVVEKLAELQMRMNKNSNAEVVLELINAHFES